MCQGIQKKGILKTDQQRRKAFTNEKSLIPAPNVSNNLDKSDLRTDQQLRKALFLHQMCRGIRKKSHS